MAMTHSSNRISSRRVGSSRGGGWFFSSRSGDGGNKNKNTSLLGHRPLVSQRSFFWLMSAMLGLLTISTLHVNIKYIKDASRSSDAYTNNIMLSHLRPPSTKKHKRIYGHEGTSESDESRYLQSLRDNVEANYREQCEDLVVYSAAFGDQFAGLVRRSSFFHTNVLQAIEKYGTCMFIFTSVTPGDYDQFEKQKKGHPNIIPLDLTKLAGRQPIPTNVSKGYVSSLFSLFVVSKRPQNNAADRRNVKLLKLNPSLLFPWAKRIIWQDVKMMDKNKYGYSLPTDYLGRYHETIERHGVCAGFMGLPFHRNTVGQNAESVTLKDHCDAIVAAKAVRETVTDNIDILLAQCNLYYKKYTNMSVPGAHVFHQHPLIDSAFMMFDMQAERCRQYNADLLGTWLKEIYSHSDRDQVSFSTALASSHVHVVDCNKNDGSEHCIASNRDSGEGQLEGKWSQFEEGSVVDVLYDEYENEQPYWSKATVLERTRQDDGDSRYNVIHHFDAYFQKNVHKEKIRMARYDARVYANEYDERVVHISDTSCHWYMTGEKYMYRKPTNCGPPH